MKNRDWYCYRNMNPTLPLLKGETMSQTPMPAPPPPPPAHDPRDFDGWARDFNLAACAFELARLKLEQSQRGPVRTAYQLREAKARYADALRWCVKLLRERCGQPLIDALAEVAKATDSSAPLETETEWRPDDRVELCEGDDSGVDLDAADREDHPHDE